MPFPRIIFELRHSPKSKVSQSELTTLTLILTLTLLALPIVLTAINLLQTQIECAMGNHIVEYHAPQSLGGRLGSTLVNRNVEVSRSKEPSLLAMRWIFGSKEDGVSEYNR
jgi:hypothetical protein